MEDSSLESKESKKQTPLKILIVENDREIAELVKSFFEGHSVTTFMNKEEALDELRNQKEDGGSFDLVITSRGFAGRLQVKMDGFEFIKKIREEGLGNPYVLMMTRSADLMKEDNNWKQSLGEKGINDLIDKLELRKELLLSLVSKVREFREQSGNPQTA